MKIALPFLIFFTLSCTNFSFAQCGAGTDKGVIVPVYNWTNTASIGTGQRPYWSFSATNGTIYSFSNCNGTSEDTKLRIYNASWTEITSNDDNGPYCSGSSSFASIDWNCTATGTYYVMLTHYDCNVLSNNQVLSYKMYCPSSGNLSYSTSVTNVTFNTINNTTAKPAAYNNYTATSTTVNVGSSYNLNLKLNTAGNYTVYAKVWVDWNNNGNFSDAGEEYDLGSVTNNANGATSLSPKNITIPGGATGGNTIMRVSCKYNAYSTACETGFDGEVEDYTLNVITSPPTITSLSNNNSYNDKAKSITVTGTNFTGATSVKIGGSGGTSLSYTVNSSTQITATIPAGLCTQTNAQITVQNSAGYSADVAADDFTVNMRNTIPVGGGTDYHTDIQSAIDGLWSSLNCSGSGGNNFTATKTIEVYSGTYTTGDGSTAIANFKYNFNPTATYRLILQNASGQTPIINASGKTYGIYVQDQASGGTDYVTVDGFTVYGASSDGIRFQGGNGIIQKNIVYDNTSYNILVNGQGNGNEIAYNKCYYNSGTITDAGIKISSSNNANVHNNLCYNHEFYGIQITSSNNCAIKNNTCTENGSSSVSETSQTFNYTTPTVNIPDYGCPTYVSVTQNVGITQTITKVEVIDMNITHTWDGDLNIYLRGPDGTEVPLSLRRGSSGDNFTNTRFADAAATAISAGSAPFNSSYKPESPLTTFSGKSSNGNWSLKVCDAGSGDIGSVTSWKLKVFYNLPGASTGAGLYVESGTNTVVSNNIFVAKSASGDQFYAMQTAVGVTIDNSSGYNDYEENGNLYFISQSTKYNDVPTWNATTQGNNDISDNPLFVSASDWHEKSDEVAGTYTGGTWPPTTASGGTWTRYANQHSTIIDKGNSADSYTNEPSNNGGRINMGCYGNTAQASKANCTLVDAGADDNICGAFTNLAGNTPQSGFTGAWSVISGAGTFADNTLENTSVNGLSLGANVFRWTLTNGSCSSNDDVTITSLALSDGGTVSPATSLICSSTSTSLTVSGYVGSIQWQNSTDSSTWSNIIGATSATYTTPLLTVTTHYRAVITNGFCPSALSTDGKVYIDNTCGPPANDNPCNGGTLTAIDLGTPNTTCSYTQYTNVNATATAGIPAPGCAGYTSGDVWFRATVPASGKLIFDTDALTLTDGGMAIYTNANTGCPNGVWTLVECDDDDGNGNMPMIDRSTATLTAGSKIWIRVWGYSGATGTFNMCVFEPGSTPNAPVLQNTSAPTGSNANEQIAFNNCRNNSTLPIFSVVATCASAFNTFQIELNTKANFSGTSYTQTISGSYTSGTMYNLLCSSLSPSLPNTSDVSYYVRVKASSNGGVTYGSWSTTSAPWIYTVSTGVPGWHFTTKDQFDQGSKVTANYGNYIVSNDNGTSNNVNDDYLEIGMGSFSRAVQSASDDGVYEGSWFPNVSFMTTGFQSGAGCGTYDIFTAYRFSGLCIPKDAVISNAKFYNYSTTDGVCKDNDNPFNLKLKSYKADNPTSLTGAIASSASTNWSTAESPTWQYTTAAWADNALQTSPDISSVLQEITSRAGWASGNALILRTEWDTRGSYAKTDNRHRFVRQYDYSSAKAAYITGDFTNFTNEIRFPNIILNSFKSNGSSLAWDKLIVNEDESGCGTCAIDYDVRKASDNTSISGGFKSGSTPISLSTSEAQVYVVIRIKRNSSPKLLDFTITVLNTVLPVELLTFTGAKKETDNHLNWVTASELNNDYFTIERSKDGVIFEAMGKVKGNGTTPKVNKYAFVDDAPYQQTYYRLKQVDYDGKFEYSKIVYLERGNQTPLQNNILVYPNPTKNTLSVDVSLIGNESVEIAVFDAKGSLVYKGNKQMEKGLNQTVLDVNSYTKGLYLIKISGLNSGYYSSTSFIKE